MPFRTRIKRAFTFGSQDENSLDKVSSKASKRDPRLNDPNVYQPGEKMPPLKYRRPVAPEHKEKLEAFTWAKAWRRRSDQSVYSPMGSRMPSRKNSRTTLGRRSFGNRSRKSFQSRRASSRGSRGPRDELGIDSGFGGSMDGIDRPEQVIEDSDDEGDVLNVGLSRNPTEDPRNARNRPTSAELRRGREGREPSPSGSERATTATATGDRLQVPNKPFAPEDLELALKRSHLEAPKEESDRSNEDTPMNSSVGQGQGLRKREQMMEIPMEVDHADEEGKDEEVSVDQKKAEGDDGLAKIETQTSAETCEFPPLQKKSTVWEDPWAKKKSITSAT